MSLLPYLLILSAVALQEELACIAAALAAARGDVHWAPALATCVLGTFAMDSFYLLCGRFGGRWALERPPICWLVSPHRLNVAVTVLGRYGSAVVVLSRFLPGLRTALQFAAGLVHENVRRAIPLLLVACAVYVSALFGLAYWLGEAVAEQLPAYQRYGVPVLACVGLVIALAVFVIRRRVGLLLARRDERLGA